MDKLGANAANDAPLTPLNFLDRAATIYADSPSIIYDNTIFTWSETRSRCLRLASALTSYLSISPGDVVSVVAPNIPAIYEMHFAVPMAGAVLNTLNARLDARTLSVLIGHSSAKLIFVDHDHLPLVRTALSLLAADRPPILVPITDHQPHDSTLTYEDLIARGDPNFEWRRPESDWTPMVLNYTSGTTSAPKGAVHCHRDIYLISLGSIVEWSMPKQPVYLWTLPMFHGNGWCFPWTIAALGGTNVCLRRFDSEVVYSAIRRHLVTHLCAAPVVLNMLAGGGGGGALPHRVEILTGGAPPPAAVLERAESIGFTVTHGYGMTETGGTVVFCTWKRGWDALPAGERARLKARQGVRMLAVDEVDVVAAATGRSVARDGRTMGEVVLRGPSVMLGYLKDAEASERCIGRGRWLYTGDVGVMHPDGYLEIKDRSKDVIISGGENISSVEVESVLSGHPGVSEVAVVARPDEYWGESPCAFVVLKEGWGEGRVTERELMGYGRERLPGFMVPKTVVFVGELPRTPTGKILKSHLKEEAKKLGTVLRERKIRGV